MSALGLSLLLLPFLLGIWGATRHPSRAFVVSFALLPWTGLDADPGLRVTAFQLYYLPLFVKFILTRNELGKAIPKSASLAAFLAYAVLISLVILPFLPEVKVRGGVFRSPELRAVIQIFMLFFSVSPFYLAFRFCKTQAQMLEALGWFVLSCLFLAIVGFIQLAIWYSTGIDPLPVGFISSLITPDSVDIRSGIFSFGERSIYRMSSLGGEPKNLGHGLALTLLIFIWAFVNKVQLLKRGSKLIAFVIFVALFLTQSTSAFISFIIGFIGLIVVSLRSSKRMAENLLKLIFLLISAFAGLTLIASVLFDFSVVDVITERTTLRAASSETGYLDDFDAVIVDYLMSNPLAMIFGSGVGNVHLFANQFLPLEVAIYAEGTSFTAKSGLIKIISEMGLFGFILFGLFFLSTWIRVRLRSGERISPLVMAVVLSYMSVSTVGPFFFVIGMAMSAANVRRG